MPQLVMIGGPNGAGKTTLAFELLPADLRCEEFVNADSIAAGLSPFRPHTVSFEAGRLMLRRIHMLAEQGTDFAFETTMASRSFAPFLENCRRDGYSIHLIYMWLRSPDLAVARVAERVKQGGHDVPEDMIRRRYFSGIRNFFNLYIPLANTWVCYNTSHGGPAVIAHQSTGKTVIVEREKDWNALKGVVP